MTGTLRVVSAVAGRELRVAARYPVSVVNLLVLMPLYQLVLPAILLGTAFLVDDRAVGLARTAGTEDLAGWLSIGMAFGALIIGTVFGVSRSITTDRELGVLEHSWIARSPREYLILGSVASSALLAGLAGFVLLVLGAVVFGASYSPWAVLALPVLLVGLIGVAGLAYLLAAAQLAWRNAGVLVDVVGYLVTFGSGVAFPLAVLPGWTRIASYGLPTTWAIDLTRVVALDARPLVGTPTVEVTCLVVTSVLWLVAGWTVFGRVERRMLAHGLLSHH